VPNAIMPAPFLSALLAKENQSPRESRGEARDRDFFRSGSFFDFVVSGSDTVSESDRIYTFGRIQQRVNIVSRDLAFLLADSALKRASSSFDQKQLLLP